MNMKNYRYNYIAVAVSIILVLITNIIPYHMFINNYKYFHLAKTYANGFSVILFLFSILFLFISFLNIENLLIKYSRELFIFTLFLVFISLFIMVNSRYYAFNYYADLANNLEIFYRLRRGDGITSPMFYATGVRAIHWFSHHFSPLIYIIVFPFFYIFPFFQTIIILEITVILSSSIAITLIAKEILFSKSGYFLGLCFLLYPTIHFTLLYDFGLLQFCIGFISWMIYFFMKRNYAIYYLFLILALICREDVGLTLIFWGGYITIIKKEYREGVFTIILSAIYTYITLVHIMPYFQENLNFHHIGNFARYGKSIYDIFTHIISNPITVILDQLTLIKVMNFSMFMLPLGFLVLLSPSVFSITIFNLCYLFLSETISSYSYFLYYTSPSIPFFFLATIYSVRKLEDNGIKNAQLYLVIWAVLINIFFSPSIISKSFWLEEYKLGNFYTTNWHKSIYKYKNRNNYVYEALSMIPDEAIVIASMPILPHLYKKKEIYIFTGLGSKSYNLEIDPDFILIDWKHKIQTGYRNKPNFHRKQLGENSKLSIVYDKDGVILYKNTK